MVQTNVMTVVIFELVCDSYSLSKFFFVTARHSLLTEYPFVPTTEYTERGEMLNLGTLIARRSFTRLVGGVSRNV